MVRTVPVRPARRSWCFQPAYTPFHMRPLRLSGLRRFRRPAQSARLRCSRVPADGRHRRRGRYREFVGISIGLVHPRVDAGDSLGIGIICPKRVKQRRNGRIGPYRSSTHGQGQINLGNCFLPQLPSSAHSSRAVRSRQIVFSYRPSSFRVNDRLNAVFKIGKDGHAVIDPDPVVARPEQEASYSFCCGSPSASSKSCAS